MMYLLDTSVISEYIKKQPSQKVIDWLDDQDERRFYISCLTIAELKKGYYKLKQKNSSRGNDERVKKIQMWIEKVEERFQDRTVHIDMNLLDTWANLCGSSEAEGKTLPVLDSLLVATARIHDMVVVTRNVADFQNCSKTLGIFNPY